MGPKDEALPGLLARTEDPNDLLEERLPPEAKSLCTEANGNGLVVVGVRFSGEDDHGSSQVPTAHLFQQVDRR